MALPADLGKGARCGGRRGSVRAAVSPKPGTCFTVSRVPAASGAGLDAAQDARPLGDTRL